MTDTARINVVELTVTELSAALKRTVEDSFGHVRVRGEVSGYRGPHSSGHVYFALKDESARIDAVIWKGVFGKMRIQPEEGLEVIVTGRLTTYPGRSNYQIVIETLEPAGVGALLKQLEERKKKLAAEGLFDEARKQLIPFMPLVIGVVTSPTGAVIRDILHRLADRFPRDVIVWPVRVQGDGAANEIAAAIRGFNALPDDGPIRKPDVLIVARGGGSLEDLWCFNEEIVVRAAAESMIPLISAVGHETDITLIDFASDRRAPTPTAAAEMAVPVRTELLSQIAALGARQVSCWQRGLEIRKRELRSLARALPTADRLFADRRQHLDNLSERLPRALRANAHVHHQQFSRITGRLSPVLLRTRIERGNILLDSLFARKKRAYVIYLEKRNDRVDSAKQLLNAFSYRGVLSRGFSLVRDRQGVPLRAAASVTPGMRLDIEFSDGRVGAIADGGNPDASDAPKSEAPRSEVPRSEVPKPKAKSGGRPGQGSLF